MDERVRTGGLVRSPLPATLRKQSSKSYYFYRRCQIVGLQFGDDIVFADSDEYASSSLIFFADLQIYSKAKQSYLPNMMYNNRQA